MDKPLVQITEIERELEIAEEPAEILQIDAKAAGFQKYMRESGLYRTDEIRPVNELYMRARWKLGRALSKVERGTGPGRGKKVLPLVTSFRALLRDLSLPPPRALEAQRIGALPDPELRKVFARNRELDVINTFDELIDVARPYWYAESRKTKHVRIAARAAAMNLPDGVGPFPLIYADPPWKFDVYSDMGLDRTPDQHYPTLTDDEIIKFKVGKQRVSEIALKDAALLMWCTSSNIHRALKIMDRWGFEYKTQAVWVKNKTGLGLVFRNKHEVLLYGTRGNMPGPQYQPPSVFEYPRGRHSAKPREIRTEIERMYPDFDARTRLELFSRESSNEEWTCYGFEATGDLAA